MSYTSHPKPRINKWWISFNRVGHTAPKCPGPLNPLNVFECIFGPDTFAVSQRLCQGCMEPFFCRSDLSSSGPPQRQGAAHLDHEQRSRISRKQDIRMCNCASCNGNSNQTQLWGINHPITNSLKSCQWQQKVSEENEQKTLPIWAFDIKILDVNLYYEDNSWK